MMRISNFTEFYNLIKHMNLQTVSPFDNFIGAVDKYKASCECVDYVDRTVKKKAAETLYVSMARGVFSQYSRRVGDSTIFFNEGKIICKY